MSAASLMSGVVRDDIPSAAHMRCVGKTPSILSRQRCFIARL